MHLRKARIPAEIVDVSRHGIFVKMADPPPLSHIVALTINLPAGAFDVMATVQRRRTDGFDEQGAGMLFFCMGASGRARWDTYVEGGIDPGLLVTATTRPSAAAATFLVQLPDVSSLLQFFDDKIVPLRTVYVMPPVRQVGAHLDVVLVHPDTDEEAVFGAAVVELNSDRPGRMGIRFDPLGRAQRRAFLAMLGPIPGVGTLSQPDGRPLLDVGNMERVTEYAFISPKLRRQGARAEPEHDEPPELELMDKNEVFDFAWDATKGDAWGLGSEQSPSGLRLADDPDDEVG